MDWGMILYQSHILTVDHTYRMQSCSCTSGSMILNGDTVSDTSHTNLTCSKVTNARIMDSSPAQWETLIPRMSCILNRTFKNQDLQPHQHEVGSTYLTKIRFFTIRHLPILLVTDFTSRIILESPFCLKHRHYIQPTWLYNWQYLCQIFDILYFRRCTCSLLISLSDCISLLKYFLSPQAR